MDKDFFKLVFLMVFVLAIIELRLWERIMDNSESILRVVGLLLGAAIMFIPIFIRMTKRKK